MGSRLNTLPPHNSNYPCRMCGVVLDKYVWRSDVEKGKGRREEPKRWWHATTAAPPQSQRLGDWSWIILNYLETDRRICWIIKDYPSSAIQDIGEHFLTEQIPLVLNCWQAWNLIQDSDERKSLIPTTEWDNPRAWYIIESQAPWSTEPRAGLTLDDWPHP